MVFITHDLQEALKLGDRIALMRDGRVVQLGTPEEIVGAPADDYVRAFVQDVPREQVLTVRTAMRPASPAEQSATGPVVAPDATVSEAIETVSTAGAPARVLDAGACVGMVDAETLLNVVAGTDPARAGTDTVSLPADTGAVPSAEAGDPAADGGAEPSAERGAAGPSAAAAPGTAVQKADASAGGGVEGSTAVDGTASARGTDAAPAARAAGPDAPGTATPPTPDEEAL